MKTKPACCTGSIFFPPVRRETEEDESIHRGRCIKIVGPVLAAMIFGTQQRRGEKQ